MNYKVGDIIYNRRHELWRDQDPRGEWHQVYPLERFKIVAFYRSGYTKKVELLNLTNNYPIALAIIYLEEDFYTNKQYRKIKLQQVNDSI